MMRGYVLEIYAGHFELPELGPIGGNNGLANPQDFAYPKASPIDTENDKPWTIVCKFSNDLFASEQVSQR